MMAGTMSWSRPNGLTFFFPLVPLRLSLCLCYLTNRTSSFIVSLYPWLVSLVYLSCLALAFQPLNLIPDDSSFGLWLIIRMTVLLYQSAYKGSLYPLYSIVLSSFTSCESKLRSHSNPLTRSSWLTHWNTGPSSHHLSLLVCRSLIITSSHRKHWNLEPTQKPHARRIHLVSPQGHNTWGVLVWV
jgi:hypothetical protein